MEEKDFPILRATVTFTMEYPANPAYYGTDDPVEMARIDQESMQRDPSVLLDDMEHVAKVEVVDVST